MFGVLTEMKRVAIIVVVVVIVTTTSAAVVAAVRAKVSLSVVVVVVVIQKHLGYGRVHLTTRASASDLHAAPVCITSNR